MNKVTPHILLLLSLLFSSSVFSHQLSTAYINMKTEQDTRSLQGQYQIRLFDLERKLNIDSNLDGQLIWREVLQNQSRIESLILSMLQIQSNNKACTLNIQTPLLTDKHFDEGYLVADFIAQCPNLVNQHNLSILYQGMFEQDSQHKAIFNLTGYGQDPSSAISLVLHKDQQSLALDPAKNYQFHTFTTYVYQGIVHIFIGIDHILFLVVLMMTCVFYREKGQWISKPSLSSVVKTAAWIVTAFTLAHSVTLTATAMGWIAPNSRWVEFGIALSVALTAFNNIWPLVTRLGWITFAFGLLHGMGFASVLSELGISNEHQVLSILAFNIGVEIGQLAILGLVLPTLYILRHNRHYKKWGLPGGSLIIGVIAVNWAIQRF
jgi:hypothetical protein